MVLRGLLICRTETGGGSTPLYGHVSCTVTLYCRHFLHYTHTHTHTLACRHTCMHTHTHSRTHARTHTHTALNTHTKTRTPELNIPHNTSTKKFGFSVIVVVCFFQSFVNQKCWLFYHFCSVLFSNFLCVKYERLNSDLLSCSGTDEKTTKALHPESPEHRSMAASSVSKVMTQPHRTRESEHG